MNFVDLAEKNMFLRQCRAHMGRSCVTQIRNELNYYNYIHKEDPLGPIIKSY